MGPGWLQELHGRLECAGAQGEHVYCAGREREFFLSWGYITSGLGRTRSLFTLTNQLCKLSRASDASIPEPIYFLCLSGLCLLSNLVFFTG